MRSSVMEIVLKQIDNKENKITWQNFIHRVLRQRSETVLRCLPEKLYMTRQINVAKCNFSAWREKYERPALDGTHWHLEIQYADGRTMESNGLNDYPDEWRNFMAVWRFCKRITEIASMR